WMLRDIRWSYVSFALSERLNETLRRRRNPLRAPDGFVIEAYNPTDEPITLTLSMFIQRTKLNPAITANQLPPPYFGKLTIPPGHFLEIVPFENFRAIIECGLPFGIGLTPQSEEGAHLVFLTLDLVAQRKDMIPQRPSAAISQSAAKPAKCVVFDLD